MQTSAPSSPITSDPFGFACKLALSGIVVYSAWQGVNIYRLNLSLQRETQPFAASTVKPRVAERPARKTRLPWPAFPGAQSSRSVPAVLNNFRFTSDTFIAPAAPREVIDFYRRAMLARGWADVTEEYLGLNPKAIDCSGHAGHLQDEEYLKQYDSVRGSHLVLRRGTEIVQIRSMPVEGRTVGTRSNVLLTHTDRSDFNELALDLSDRYQKAMASWSPRRVWQSGEVIGSDLYETGMFVSRQTPADASASLIQELARDGWNPVFSSTHTPRAGAPGFVYLARGSDFALITVTGNQRGRPGTTAMLATVVDAQPGRDR